MAGTSKCIGCGSPIKWIRTVKGKHMPCDPERKIISNLGMGSDTFVLTSGETVKGDEADNVTSSSLDKFLVGYLPHWISCPKAKVLAKSFKKKK